MSSAKRSRELIPTEELARYLTESDHFVESKGRVKRQAFQPLREDASTSTFRVYELTESAIWELAHHVEETKERRVLARADLTVAEVLGTGLRLDPDDNPPRHVAIVGWPMEEKDQVMSLCLELAAVAKLRVRPPELS